MPGWSPPALPARWSSAVQPTFVGRQREIAILESAWDAAAAGARQVVFLGGEPGAGKSRLLAGACRGLSRAGAAVLVGSCIAEFGFPYQPFDGPAGVLLEALAGTVGPLDAASARRRRLAVIAGATASTGAGPVLDDRRETFESLAGAVRDVAAERPVVLALEDLHWAGATALQLLAYAVQRTAEARVLVLATHRTTAPDRSGDLAGQIASLIRLDGVRRVDLDPLDTEDIADYLVGESGIPRDRARSAAALLRDRTGGNPFLLRQLWEHLSTRGGVSAVRVAAEPPPQIIRDTVRHRVAPLSADARQVLALAAVLGEEVDVATLSEVHQRPDLLVALDELQATGLLVSVPGAGDSCRFTHALTRQVVLDDLPAADRARLHERVAIVLERRGSPVERLAHHYAAAHLLGHADKAVRYLTDAARLADRALAHAEAARLHERAATLSRDRPQRDEHMLAAARSSLLACDFARARELSLAVVGQGDPGTRLRAATAFEDACWFSGGAGSLPRGLLEDVLDGTEPRPEDPAYIRAVAGLARARALSGDDRGADTLIEDALAMARATGDGDLVGDALAASMQVGMRPGDRGVKRARADELIEAAAGAGRWLHLGPAAYHRAVLAYQDGDIGTLDECCRSMERVAGAIGHRYWAYLAGCADYARLLMAARFDAAAQACRALLDLDDVFQGDDLEGPYGVQSFMVRREAGHLEAVRSIVTGTESIDDHWAPALLALYTELGMVEPAGRALHALLGRGLGWERHHARWPGVLAFAAEATVALSDADAARTLLPWLDEFAGLNIVMGPFVAVFGAADRYAASLLSVIGDAGADARFDAALRLDTRSGADLHRAHTLAEWALHARRTGQADRSRALAEEARALAERHGMVRVLERLGNAAAVSRRLPDGLTDREAEVLRLLGEGLSNRELARRLYISENTAANHVRSILLKTGCANRTQAAMYAAGRGLLEPR